MRARVLGVVAAAGLAGGAEAATYQYSYQGQDFTYDQASWTDYYLSIGAEPEEVPPLPEPIPGFTASFTIDEEALGVGQVESLSVINATRNTICPGFQVVGSEGTVSVDYGTMSNSCTVSDVGSSINLVLPFGLTPQSTASGGGSFHATFGADGALTSAAYGGDFQPPSIGHSSSGGDYLSGYFGEGNQSSFSAPPGVWTVTAIPSPVPLPASAGLLVAGLLSLMLLRRSRT